jgi:hypothetical protein
VSVKYKNKVLLLAPYQALYEQAYEAAACYPELFIDVYLGDYRTGPKLVKELEADNRYDVIITRGGTAQKCKEVTGLPVLDIPITVYDIINTLKLTQDYTGKVILMAHKEIVAAVERICSILETPIEFLPYTKHTEVYNLLEEVYLQRECLIVGDNIVYQNALLKGMDTILIASSVEAVKEAIDTGVKLLEYITVSNYVKEDAANSNDRMNPVSETEVNELFKEFQYISAQRIETAEWNAVYPTEIKEEVRTYGKSPFPMLIYGADSMEPDNLGIWSGWWFCKNKGNLLVCDFRTESVKKLRMLKTLLKNKQLSAVNVLILQYVEWLDKKQQLQLFALLKEYMKLNHKIIATVGLARSIADNNQILDKALKYCLEEVSIELSELREYKEELNNVISLYTAYLKLKSSTLCFRIQNKRQLINYSWPGNLLQFKQVMKKLVLESRDGIIGEDKIQRMLEAEEVKYQKPQQMVLNINQSLEAIERDVIRKVLEEEKGVHRRVEERLQISHATLWRKLKDGGVSK